MHSSRQLSACLQCADSKPASLPDGSGSCVKYGDVPGSSRGACACIECKGGFSLAFDTCQVSVPLAHLHGGSALRVRVRLLTALSCTILQCTQPAPDDCEESNDECTCNRCRPYFGRTPTGNCAKVSLQCCGCAVEQGGGGKAAHACTARPPTPALTCLQCTSPGTTAAECETIMPNQCTCQK